MPTINATRRYEVILTNFHNECAEGHYNVTFLYLLPLQLVTKHPNQTSPNTQDILQNQQLLSCVACIARGVDLGQFAL